MGLTQKLGTIPLAIQTDSSNNVGIGGAANASYKLAVTGASLFSSSINSGQIQATASGAVIQLIGQVGSNAYYVNDQVNNSGKRWRFGHTGAVSGYNSFDFYNQTDDRLVMTLSSGGNVGIGTSSPTAKLSIAADWVAGGATVRCYPLTAIASGGVAGYGMFDNDGTTRKGYINVSSNYMEVWCQQNSPMTFGTNDIERMRITSGGLVQINTTVGSATLNLKAQSGGNAIRLQNAAGGDGTIYAYGTSTTFAYGFNTYSKANAFVIEDNGYTTLNSTVYNNTSASSANMIIYAGDYALGRSTSSLRFKTDIEDIEQSYVDNIYKMKPKWYRSLCEKDNKEWSHFGFIAEEMAEIEPRLVHWFKEEDDTLRADGVQYDRITALLVKALQDQKSLIEELSAKVTALENK